MFAIAMSLVLFISTAVLLYQFWTGALLDTDAQDTPATDTRPADAAPAARARRFRIDSAA